MLDSKMKLLSTVAAVPLAIGAAVAFSAIGTISGQGNVAYASYDACNPCAAKKACNPCNPCAAKKACNPCNPCAAKKACNPCNPCAAKKACNPCNPCAAKKACNPCNPCAAKKACNPCNPCAAKKACNPCNPCAAANPCNPCNPCAASASGGSLKCYIPRLRTAAACNPCAAKKACNPCNPCAAKKACNPCNPCAAKKACNPCNPCAAKKASNPCNPCAAANPCNPCAAANPCNPCAAANPCNPCGAAAAAPELSEKELVAAYNCLYPEMQAGYAKAGIPAAKGYKKWAKRFSRVSYQSDTHGGRMVNNYSNSIGKKAYGKYEDLKKAPVGSVYIKDSFSVGKNGSLSAGPIFLMEKKPVGFDKANGDWRYYLIMPNGNLMGTTKGKNSAGVKFCADCHNAAAETDFLYFLPEEVRVSSK